MSTRKRKWTYKGESKEAWVVNYSAGGKRYQKTFKFKRDADAYEAKVKHEKIKGTHVAERASTTVAKAAALWLVRCQDGAADQEPLERSSLERNERHVRRHIVTFIGDKRLTELTLPGLREFEDALRTAEKPRSPALIRGVIVSLGSLLGDAQERGLVAHNVVRERRKAKKKGGKPGARKQLEVGKDIPTPAEVKALIPHLARRWKPVLMTAIFTGLRASELRGLRWDDVDLKRGELHVRQRADKWNAIGAPKSKAGTRTVPLPPTLVSILREWKLACPPGPLGLAFPNKVGGVDDRNYIAMKGLHPAMVKAGLVTKDGKVKYPGLHALRHFYASWCLNRKADGGLELPLKVVQARLGHSSIAMTADVYGHLFPNGDDGKELADAAQALLG